MQKTYGNFDEKLGSYSITELPKVGSYEYIYKNDGTLLKLDQFGIQTVQIDAPVGIAVMKREKREQFSPVKTYFDFGSGVFHNFDVFRAEKLRIDFTPEKATYFLAFKGFEVKTEVFLSVGNRIFTVKTTLKNTTEETKKVSVLFTAYPYMNELMMAPWDKPEWYTRAEYLPEDDAFKMTRYSVDGNVADRRYLFVATDKPFTSTELSAERLFASTNGFTYIPDAFSGKTENTLYAFEQAFGGITKVELKAGEKVAFTQAFATAKTQEELEKMKPVAKSYFDEKTVETEIKEWEKRYEKLFAVRKIATPDKDFDAFVNGFLPLELSWVSSLDRGWPTGMRGVRDASNDFEGYLAYDEKLCKEVIENILSKQRFDGWYPRQVPFGQSQKFDLRHFIDGVCFFTEYVYDYLAFTGDYSVLTSEYPYYDNAQKESGFTHIKKGIEYLMQAENTGMHGLVKMQGGDWLDCLNKAGVEGIGETVMVSCQLVMSIRYLAEIMDLLKIDGKEKYLAFADELKENINKASYNQSGFYNGVFTDKKEWIFSENDPDGEKRIYAPTNTYAIISGVAEGKEQAVIGNLETLKTTKGYRLFSTPFGVKKVDNIGKMGTGDFQPFFAENASVYNHGSQCFYLRALAKVGDYEKFASVLDYALPLYADKHAPDDTCSAPYAITNCYHLVPSFSGRSGFSFLTGSVAMIERAIYSWMFGIGFTLSGVEITPCIPERYKNAEVTLFYLGKKMEISFVGYGATVVSATVNKKAVAVEKGKVVLENDTFETQDTVKIVLTMQQK